MYTEQDLACPATVTFLQWRFLLAEGMAFVLAMFVVWWWRGWWARFWPLIVPPKKDSKPGAVIRGG